MLLAAITVVAVVRVAATHGVFTQVLDEPAHIGAGYAFLSGQGYNIDASHPPLARVLMAAPLLAERIPSPPPGTDLVERGNTILYHGDRFLPHLRKARLGNLLFLAVAIVCTALWARRTCGDAIALLAAALLSLLPAFLGHSGVATTDVPAAAAVAAALLAFSIAVERPTLRNALLFGAVAGLGVLAKFSFPVFFPPAALALLLATRPRLSRAHAAAAAIAIVTSLLVIWGGYGFDFGPVEEGTEIFASAVLPEALADGPLPAPMFFAGLGIVKLHNAGGHLSFLLGRYSESGFWYYFPVILFFKTPLPFLLLALLGAWQRKAWPFLLAALAMLAVAMSSSINIGIRHVLPLYPPLAVVAACGVMTMVRWQRERIALAALLAWLLIGTTLAHPDYLAWFNEAARGEPERIATDSNLDWGQDVLRLQRFVQRRGIDEVSVLYVGNAWLHAHGIHAVRSLQPYTEQRGWIVVSETGLALTGRNGEYRWLTSVYRPTRVGRSLRVYYVP